MPREITRDRRQADGKAELRKLASGRFGAPEAILLCHPADESDGLAGSLVLGLGVLWLRLEPPGELEELSMRDMLTGLYNQRAFFE